MQKENIVFKNDVKGKYGFLKRCIRKIWFFKKMQKENMVFKKRCQRKIWFLKKM